MHMMDHPILDSPRAWMRLGITLAAGLVINAGMWMITVTLPAIQAELGVSRSAVSAAYAVTMIGFALGNFLGGRAVDRFGLPRVLALAALVTAIAFLLAANAQTLLLLCLAQGLIGLGTAVGFGPMIADISHWFLRRRGLAVALVASGNYLSGAFWPWITSGLLLESGWRAVYLLMAGITLLAVLPLAIALRSTLPHGARQSADKVAAANAQSTGLRPMYLAGLLGIAGIGCCVAMSMPQVHIVAYCVDLGYGPAVGAEMLSLMLLGGVASRIISGLIADRLGGVRTLLIGSVLQCLALVAYLPSDAMVSLYIVSAVFGLSQGGIVPSYALIVREYMPARQAGTLVGFVMMATIFGMALGGWVSGLIYDATGSYLWAFWNGILWNGINIAIILWLLNRTRQRPEATSHAHSAQPAAT